MALDSGVQSGRKVIDARGIAKSFGDRVILRPFDLRVLRGDRIAFVGPNGTGKTTLLKMLTGELPPDAGTVTHGTNLEIANVCPDQLIAPTILGGLVLGGTVCDTVNAVLQHDPEALIFNQSSILNL